MHRWFRKFKRFVKGILGSKRSRPPRKILRNAPLYVLPQIKKKIIPCTLRIRGTLVFLCPKEKGGGERERGVETGREKERERGERDK
jgi:hypothetical protein